MTPTEPATLWTPSAERVEASRMAAYMRWLAAERGLEFDGYDALWKWSVTDLEGFWQSIADYFGVRWHSKADRVLGSRTMPGAEWFPGGTLNWAEHALRADDDSIAIVYRSEEGQRTEWTYGELADQVARIRTGLGRLGVTRGDRVAGFLANTPEAVAALLACASLGAIWSSCPPEFGASAVLDRFRQIEPKVFLAHDGYPYNGRFFDRTAEAEEIRGGLPSLEATVLFQRAGGLQGETLPWQELTSEARPLEFEPVPFAHPLWILYSSGTTGLPKRSSTARAAFSSSTTSSWRCTATSVPRTASSGSRPRVG